MSGLLDESKRSLMCGNVLVIFPLISTELCSSSHSKHRDFNVIQGARSFVLGRESGSRLNIEEGRSEEKEEEVHGKSTMEVITSNVTND